MNKLIPILALATIACGYIAELPTYNPIPNPAPVPQGATFVSAEVALNLRDLPEHLGGDVITEMLNGDNIKILRCENFGDNGIWAVVEYQKNGKNPMLVGYASMDYISGECPNE